MDDAAGYVDDLTAVDELILDITRAHARTMVFAL